MLANEDNMSYILMALDASEEVGIDTETTGLNVRNGVDYLTGLGLAVEGFKCYIPFRHGTDNVSKRWIAPIMECLEQKPLDWHNRKFDMHSLRTLGVDPLLLRGPHYDTLLIAHLVDEELPSKELDWLSKKFLKDQKLDGTEIKELGKIYGWGNIPPHIMGPYGEHDPDLHRRLKNVLWPKLVDQGLQSVYWDTESRLTTSLYQMEQRGVGVNKTLCSSLQQRGRGRMDTIQRELKFNPASPVDLGHYLLTQLELPVLALTPKGKPSFNKVAMEGYDEILQASNNPTARRIAEYRGWQKATTSLYEPLLERIGPDGRIRTSFKEHGTVTGRLSAAEPNLQQVPRGSNKLWNGKAKACFTSGREDYLLYGWDYSQIELRLAAAYGNERTLLDEFAKPDADPFRVYCSILFGSFTPEGRQNTKTFFYANLYGAGLEKIRATLGWTIAETKPIFDKFRASIPGITQVSRQVNDLMARQGYVSYWDGRRRHIKWREEQHKAWNSVIQGGAAQLVKKAVIRCSEFADDDCYPVLTVHDEITFCVKKEALPDYEPKIIKAMTEWPEYDFPVPFTVEGKEWK